MRSHCSTVTVVARLLHTLHDGRIAVDLKLFGDRLGLTEQGQQAAVKV